MQALGNDFVMIDGVSQGAFKRNGQAITREMITHLANRYLGIGCDQLLIAQKAVDARADIFCQIFNADGSEAEQCGNGLRCFARFIHDLGLINKTRNICIETCAGFFQADILNDGLVKINMGQPVFEPEKIPFNATALKNEYKLALTDNDEVTLGAVSMGNPHAVMKVKDISTAPVLSLGEKIESHESFPKRVNVEFMQIIDTRSIALRIFERGAGETRACGSGACAAVVVGQMWGD